MDLRGFLKHQGQWIKIMFVDYFRFAGKALIVTLLGMLIFAVLPGSWQSAIGDAARNATRPEVLEKMGRWIRVSWKFSLTLAIGSIPFVFVLSLMTELGVALSRALHVSWRHPRRVGAIFGVIPAASAAYVFITLHPVSSAIGWITQLIFSRL